MTAIPPVSRETIERVMDNFEDGPCSPRWRGGAQAALKWGIRRSIGRFLPVKEVIRRAVYLEHGTWPEVADTEQARKFVLDRGFTLVRSPFPRPLEGFVPAPWPHYTVVLRPDDHIWYAEIPALPACYTDGRTLEEALKEIQDVYKLVMEELEDEGKPFPPDVPVKADATSSTRG
jgi:predicted RNase H-like HicB family nuclease